MRVAALTQEAGGLQGKQNQGEVEEALEEEEEEEHTVERSQISNDKGCDLSTWRTSLSKAWGGEPERTPVSTSKRSSCCALWQPQASVHLHVGSLAPPSHCRDRAMLAPLHWEKLRTFWEVEAYRVGILGSQRTCTTTHSLPPYAVTSAFLQSSTDLTWGSRRCIFGSRVGRKDDG